MPVTIKQAKKIILDDYYRWYKRGIETGIWHQQSFIFLRSVAGVGKTEICFQAGNIIAQGYKDLPPLEHAKRPVQLFFSSAMDPESIAGTPSLTNTKIRKINPNFDSEKPESDENPRLVTETIRTLSMHYRDELINAQMYGPGSILFIDELGRESPHMRAAQLKLLSPEKTLAGLDMNPFYIICAGNPSDEEHRVDDVMSDAAMSSRLIPVDIKPSPKEWADWMYAHNDPTYQEVANFILDNPDLLIGRDDENKENSQFHNPRAWTTAAWVLRAHGGGTEKEVAEMKGVVVNQLVNGAIGANGATKLSAYLNRSRVMTLKTVLQGKFTTNSKTNRIHDSVPPSVVRSLQHYIQCENLTDTEADNVARFLKAVSADIAHSINRMNKKIKPTNLTKLASRGVLSDVVKRVKDLDSIAQSSQ